MRYVENNVVYAVNVTSRGGLLTAAMGLAKRILLTASTLQWQQFDVEQGDYVDDPTNESAFLLTINDEPITIPSTHGQAEWSIEGAAGHYIVRTVNADAENEEIDVVIP